MADITSRVRFIGDAQQLLATYKAIGAQAGLLQRQINQVNSASLGQKGFSSGLLARNGQPFIKNVRTELDSLNKTLRVFGDTAIRTSRFGEFLTGTFSEVRGNTDKMAESLTRYATVENRTSAVRQRAIRDLKAETAQIKAGNAAQLQSLQRARQLAVSGRGPGGQFLGPQAAQQAVQAIDANISALQRAERAAIQTTGAYQNFLKVQSQSNARRGTAAAGVRDAQLLPSPLTAEYQNLQRLSPQAISALTKQGLATTGAGLFAQNADISINKNLVTGVTQARVAFEQLGMGMQTANLEFDKSGRLITRFGGQLSGLQNFLSQTTRNLQKVVQWGIATTAIFGSLAIAARELGVLVDLNKNLNQLAITANLTRNETNALFGELADVAIRTATPLVELTKSADDIALAVRESGKSTADYMDDIIRLTEAVGIYTNLTGEDTVKATDLLTASMKQLGLETEDITGLLSKITAVAGGQGNAIKDITSGLAAMAEAAKQAGLSVDETISTVQTLSQVTSKSPSEVATSFKNLVGALDSRAGAKALAAFNINLRDEAGNLRNILDIYGEISDKIRQGVIPADQVKGLVKAIAGGPRRAPDAAALLAAIDQIQAGVEKSVRATNEALIVNAKVLDTTQAKLVQLQVQFDKFAFEKFGEAFREFAEILTVGFTEILKVLNSVPSGFISAALQLGVFLVAIRLGIGALRLFGGIFRELMVTVAAAPAAFVAAARGANQLNLGLAGPGRAGRLTGGRGNVASIGIGAALGAGIGAAAGGDIKSIIAGGLSGAGLAALTAPIPLPWLKLGGAIALAAGTLLEFVGNSDKADDANQRAVVNAEKLLQAYTSYNEARATVEGLKKTNDELSASITNLNSQPAKTAAELAQLQDYQKQYIANTIEMSNANLMLTDSFNTIQRISPEFAGAIRDAQAGRISPQKLEEYIQKFQLELLRQTDPTAQLPTGGFETPKRAPIVNFSTSNPFVPSTLASLQVPDFGPAGSSFDTRKLAQRFNPNFSLESLTSDFESVKKLFDETGTKLTATFAPTTENIALVTGAISKLKEANDPLASSLDRTFKEFVKGASAVDGADIVLASFQNRIDALKQFLPDVAAQFQKLVDLGKQGIDNAAAKGDDETVFKIQQQLTDFFSGKTSVTETSIQPFIESIAGSMGLLSDKTLSSTDRLLVLQGVIDSASLDLNLLGENGVNALKAIDEAVIQTQENLQELALDTAAEAATRSADLQARFQGGEFKGNEANYRKELDYLSQLSETVNEVAASYAAAAETLGTDFQTELQNAAIGLTDINGLQDAQSLSTDQLIERLFSLADTYGLTGEQVAKLGDKLIGLIATINKVAAIKATFQISAAVDLKGAIAALKALRTAAQLAIGDAGRGRGRAAAQAKAGAKYDSISQAIAELEAAQSSFGGLTGGIGDIFKSGGGTSTYNPPSAAAKKKARKTGAGMDVSLLDLPEEIAKASNRDELIREAIRNARELQKKIPGAGKEAKNDIVELLKGTQRILEVRGVKDDLLRKALEELAEIEKKRLEFDTKADTIRRIRVGQGDFSAIANVPVNTKTGVSMAGSDSINVLLNVNGTVMTPAQFAQFADMIAAAIKRQLGA